MVEEKVTPMVTSAYRMVERLAVAVLLFSLSCTTASHADMILFVDDDAPPGGDGLSWDTAFRFLADALAAAEDPFDAEIRVAQGVYKPDRDDASPEGSGDEDLSFVLSGGIELLGGFAGIGAEDPDERDIEQFETILSGDLEGDDGDKGGDPYDNSHHVVNCIKTLDSPVIIDGITITAGFAHGGAFPNDRGAALFVQEADPVVRDCLITASDAAEHGAVAIVGPCSPTFSSVTFSANQSGALIIEGGAAPTFEDCTFDANTGEVAVFNDQSEVLFQHCTFSNNAEGAVRNEQADAVFVSCVFSGNSSGYGGAVESEASTCLFIDCYFSANTGDWEGGAIWISEGVATLIDCVLEENISVEGGGVFLPSGELHLLGCHFAGNRAENLRGYGGYGGGVRLVAAGELTAIDCVFEANTARWGGAILLLNNNLLDGCEFIGNEATEEGGGAVNAFYGHSIARNCRFVANTARWGGAWASYDDDSEIVSCTFVGNSTVGLGGSAIVCTDGSNPLISNCILLGNEAIAERGGAIASWDESNPTLVNCTIASNSSTGDGGGLYIGQAVGDSPPSFATVANCIFWDNTDQNYFNDGKGDPEPAQIYVDPDVQGSSVSLDYSCVKGLSGVFGGVGNIGDDPLFVDQDGPDGIPGNEDDDLRLGAGSPGIDAAFNNAVPDDVADLDDDGDFSEFLPFDLDGEPRFADDHATEDTGCGAPAIVDMGAYEFPGIPIQPIRGDITGDLSVDGADLIELLGAWGECPTEGEDTCCAADLNADGLVDGGDLLVLLGNWG